MWSLVMTFPLISIVVCFFTDLQECVSVLRHISTLNMSCFLWLIMSPDCHGRSTVPSLHSVFLLLVSMNGINLTLREKLIQSSISIWWIMVCYSYTTLSAWQKVTHYLLLVCVCDTWQLPGQEKVVEFNEGMFKCTIQYRIVVYLSYLLPVTRLPYTYD